MFSRDKPFFMVYNDMEYMRSHISAFEGIHINVISSIHMNVDCKTSSWFK